MELNISMITRSLQDNSVTVKSLVAQLTDYEWKDDTFFCAGKFDFTFAKEVNIVAELTDSKFKNFGIIHSTIGINSPYFDLVWKNVPMGDRNFKVNCMILYFH
jgi:hypothetical protein